MEIGLNPILPQNHDIPHIEFTRIKQDRLKNQFYAPLDPKTERIKKRLQQRLDAMNEHITDQSLKQTKVKIGRWIERHSPERVPVNKRSLHLFTGGQEAAPMSKSTEQIRNRLALGIAKSGDHHETLPLKGRVTKNS
jgi:hypothetical protein